MSLALVRAMPRRALSRLVGAAARVPLPRLVLAPIVGAWTLAFGCDLSEAERPRGGWGTFLGFFVRRLRPGARTMPPEPDAVASPADGRVHVSGRIAAGTVVQAKGLSYALADLLGSEEDAAGLEGGTYLAIHLAPGDYHRFHWPFDARVDLVRHLPGDLWPVHAGAVGSIERVLCRNERLVVRGSTASGGPFAFVAVGALNVGSIRLAFLDVRTNRGGRPASWALDVRAEQGAEMGWFEMGSLVFLGLSPRAGALDPVEAGSALRVGARIGRLAAT